MATKKSDESKFDVIFTQRFIRKLYRKAFGKVNFVNICGNKSNFQGKLFSTLS